MHDAIALARQNGGVLSRSQLAGTGFTDADVARAVRAGTLERLRRGWFATTIADPLIRQAVTAGGVLTCLPALRRHGVWVPEHQRKVHVRAENRGRSVRGGCRLHGPAPRPDSAVDDLLTALRYSVRCLDAEGLIVVVDSVLNGRLATVDEVETALVHAPRRVRELLARCDAQAQSGTETMVRLRLRSMNIAVTTQHPVPGVGSVDLLVGDRLVIEVDSHAHHTGVERYEADRARDRRLVQLGYVVLRLSYHQVVHDWPACEAAILDLIRRRAHRGRPAGAA
ncbi:type IV toxin-antitoxin system AbiEi family antitoxin domain-containing protein [Williamsia sp. SKLECPSW1]